MGRERFHTAAGTLTPSRVIVDALVRVMQKHDPGTFAHSERVRRYVIRLASGHGVRDARTLAALDAAALLHDVGKLGIPECLLNKPAALTVEEYDRVKEHAAMGAEILSTFAFPGPLAILVRHHHEHWDGSGYPDGLCGTRIPLGARLLAVADCYDALTSDRPYRAALSHASAVRMMLERRGWMHDPDLTDAFLDIADRMQSAAVTDRWQLLDGSTSPVYVVGAGAI